jgi:hypothetical protein
MSQIRVLQGNRESCLPSAQARLLAQINRGFTDAWWQRYHELLGKRQRLALKAAEHRELIKLTDDLERRETKRLRALVMLAKLRKQSLRDLMTDLGLPRATDA